MNRTLLVTIVLLVLLTSLAFVIPQSRFLLIGFPVERLDGTEPDQEMHSQDDDFGTVETTLLAAGLSPTPRLGDTGVSGHIARLKAGEVTSAVLKDYAAGLSALNKATATLGQPIPTSFWDVDTLQLRQDGWNSYKIVAALNSPEGAPFVTALGKAYARFHRFKTQSTDGSDTALNAALDMFEPVSELVETVGLTNLLEQSAYITTKQQAALYLWQDVVAGTSRRNPLTRQKIFDHGFATRFHVTTIWQYETGIAQLGAEIWGVTGLAPEFVGPAENNNQIEHMSISMVVQGLLREPELILNAFEDYERLTGSVSAREMRADKAMNDAVHDVFIPNFETDLGHAVEMLRAHLKAD